MPELKASLSEWPTKRLSVLVTQHKPRLITPQSEDHLRFAGVRWYGAGLFVREERLGAQVKGKCYALEPGTLIYNRLFAWKQSFAVVPDEYEGVVVSNEFPQFNVDRDQATPEYLALYCSSPAFARHALGLSTGAAAVSRNRLKEDDFVTLSAPCPPIPEQKTIVDVMSAVDAALTATATEGDRLEAALRARRSALMNSEAHLAVPAKTAFDIKLGRQRSPQRATGPSMTPYLRSANVGVDRLRLDDTMSMDFNEREREVYALHPGDVLVSEGSAGADAVGMPAAWGGEIEGPVCFQNTLLRYRAISGVTTPAFVRHWCLWAFESKTFRDVAPEGVNIKHIGDTRAKTMPVRLPDIDEQERAVAELEPLSAAVRSIRAEVAKLRVARAALLDALLGGDIELQIIE